MKPILFNTEMVKAVLDGRKTQTRRILKPQPTITDNGEFRWDHKARGITRHGPDISYMQKELPACCPYGQVGDVLYVRETFNDCDGTYYHAPIFKATSERTDLRWKPSIHMPKKYARIFLEITAIRVERLLDISEIDAMREGDPKQGLIASENTHRDWFLNLFYGIYGKEVENPWLWCVDFKIITK